MQFDAGKVFALGHEFADIGLGQLDEVGLDVAILEAHADLGSLAPQT